MGVVSRFSGYRTRKCDYDLKVMCDLSMCGSCAL